MIASIKSKQPLTKTNFSSISGTDVITHQQQSPNQSIQLRKTKFCQQKAWGSEDLQKKLLAETYHKRGLISQSALAHEQNSLKQFSETQPQPAHKQRLLSAPKQRRARLDVVAGATETTAHYQTVTGKASLLSAPLQKPVQSRITASKGRLMTATPKRKRGEIRDRLLVEFSIDQTKRLQLNFDENTTLSDTNVVQRFQRQIKRPITSQKAPKTVQTLNNTRSINNDSLLLDLNQKIQELNQIVNSHKQSTKKQPVHNNVVSRETSKPALSSTHAVSETDLPVQKKKVAPKQRNEAEEFLSLQPTEKVQLLDPREDPPFFDLFVEKRHVEQLGKYQMDDESRLEVIYRILKDQLRRAKADLLKLKHTKEKRRQEALEMKRRMLIASRQAEQKGANCRVVEVTNSRGGVSFKLDNTAQQDDPSFKKIASYLLATDVRKHNKYCPCCKKYTEQELSQAQMGEFLDYIKHLHYKLVGPPHEYRKDKPRDQRLDHDSISEITDLSEEGILTRSMNKLPTKERTRIQRYIKKMREINNLEPVKHNCVTSSVKPSKRPNRLIAQNRKQIVQLELRAKKAPLQVTTETVSAHQFSQKSISLQADSEERGQMQLETALIDHKMNGNKVDVYDLSAKQEALESNSSAKKIGFRDACDVNVGTDLHPKLLASRDWFYSDIHRRMLLDYYASTGQELCSEIQEDFTAYDWGRNTILREINYRMDLTTDGSINPQDPSSKITSEAEVDYLLGILKHQPIEQLGNVQDIYEKACFTIKLLTTEMIEGKVPICSILDQYSNANRQSLITLLTRVQKMYAARNEVKKILSFLFKAFHDPQTKNRDNLLKRLTILVEQFVTENHQYAQTFVYKGRNILDIIEQELNIVDGSTYQTLITTETPSKKTRPEQTLSQVSPSRHTSVDVCDKQNDYLRKVQNEIDAGDSDVAFRVETNIKVSKITGKGLRRTRLIQN